jgi:putative ABC transport system substrate-binding protein
MLLALSFPARAQQPKKIPRIGFLSATGPQPRNEAFREGLRELGYVEGQNIVIEWRFADGKPDRISHNAAELVGLKVDIILFAAPPPTWTRF